MTLQQVVPAVVAHGGPDPVTLQIMHGALEAAIREMEALVDRTAMSAMIKEKKDRFVGIYDASGRMVAAHLSFSGPGMIAPLLEQYPLAQIEPGDLYWFNDPFFTGGAIQHLGDMCFVAPVFAEGRVVAFAATYGHFRDIGGALPGQHLAGRDRDLPGGAAHPGDANRQGGCLQRRGVPPDPGELALPARPGRRHQGDDRVVAPGRDSPPGAVWALRNGRRAWRVRVPDREHARRRPRAPARDRARGQLRLLRLRRLGRPRQRPDPDRDEGDPRGRPGGGGHLGQRPADDGAGQLHHDRELHEPDVRPLLDVARSGAAVERGAVPDRRRAAGEGRDDRAAALPGRDRPQKPHPAASQLLHARRDGPGH